MALSAQSSALWAKMRSVDGHHLWLPLITHLVDAQNVINWLMNHWLAEGQRQLLCQSLSAEDLQKLVKFLGFMHDLGKATAAFQLKPAYNGDQELDHELRDQLTFNGFQGLDDVALALARKSPHALAGEAILESFGVPVAIGAIIGGHHGRPADRRPRKQLRTYTANYWQSDQNAALQAPWQQVQLELFHYGLSLSGYQHVAEIPSVGQPQAVILEGLLIMTDWLASSEFLDDDTQMPLFPLIGVADTWQDVDMTARFQQAILAWRREDEWAPQAVKTSSDPYQARWGFQQNSVQKVMTEAISQTLDPGMMIVEAPMGLGKTELALVATEELAYKTQRDGLFMGLPTQATTNAMFARVNTWLAQLADRQGEKLQIKLLHGKAEFNELYRHLPRATNVNQGHSNAETEQVESVMVNGWFSGKKSILADFTVGTIDHLLLMGLKQKHLFLRHLGLSNKVVIIDEVHAYDAYMNQYLYQAIEWLGAYHVPIVVLSATLPKVKRNALLQAYAKGKYGTKQLTGPSGWEATQAYPLLSLLDGKQVRQVTQFAEAGPRQDVKVQRLTLEDNDLMAHVLKRLSGGGVAGLIVNTVKRAQALADLVPADEEVLILHSAFLAPDREKQEQRLQAVIGKQGKRPAKLIVIGTQVLEQSLDIDFDVLYTDIAPMDLLLQRAGRLHRHQIKRPQALQTPQLYVMGSQTTGQYGAANEAIYEKYLLLRTDYFLNDTLKLPADISPLVQAVYDEAAPVEIPGIEKSLENFNRHRCQEQRKAQAFQIDEPDLDADATILGWLERPQEEVANDDQKASAAVRDIQETLEVILIQQTAKGDVLLDGRPLSQAPDWEIAQQVIRLPAAVTPVYQLDQTIADLEKRTSRHYAAWRESVWLRGALALLLNETLETDLGNWHLSYATTTGLRYIKGEDYG